MSHVLSYINDDVAFWDEVYYENGNTIDATFDNVYQVANAQGMHMLNLRFTHDAVIAACEKEFVDVIKPNLTEEKFVNLDINRLHVWCKIGKSQNIIAYGKEDSCRTALRHLSQFSKGELLAWVSIMKNYPSLHAWEKSGYGRDSVLGEKVEFTVEDAREFTDQVKAHKLESKISLLSNALEDRVWNERIENYFYEANELRWRSGKCVECKVELWNTQMQTFSRCNGKNSNNCSSFHCMGCIVKTLKENREQKRPIFSCGKDCNCFLKLDKVATRKSYEYFSNKLDMKEEELKTTIAEDFESCVVAPYKLLPEKVLANPTEYTLAESHRQLRNLCVGDHMELLSDETKEVVSDLQVKVENLIKMGRLRNEMKNLDNAINQVVSATIAKNDEEMLSSVKNMIHPIRSVIQNRPSQSDDIPELFGMSMLEIANSKLQRAKDVAATAYSIAKQCAICTEVVSQRAENENLMTLHDDLEKDVSAWNRRINAPCHACKDCFENFLNFKQSLGKPMLRCPGMNCRCFLDKKRVEAALPNAFAEYKVAMMRFSLKRVENYRTCPNADCASGIVLDSCCTANQVTCTVCDTSFCPKCNDEPHEGMTCEELQRKRHGERWGEAKDYMTNETKQCPYCLVWIEKNGGCNHMTCHHCRGEFCWLCFGEWHSHTSCTDKKEVTRRPFNELFPDWHEKSKTLKARFHVGRYVTVEPHTEQHIGRVVSTHEHGMYHIEPAHIPGVKSSIEGTIVVEESLLRGYNKPIPAEADAEELEEETYSSFLAGFDIDETKKTQEVKQYSVELTLKDDSQPAVELTTNGASDSESGDSTIDDEELPFFSFMKGFDDSDDEDSEDGDLLAKLDEIDGVQYYGNSHKLLQGKLELTLHAKKKLRAKREKIRERVVSDCESDGEESELYPGWLLFINNELAFESEGEEEISCDQDVVALFSDCDSSSEDLGDLGFESDDEEESS